MVLHRGRGASGWLEGIETVTTDLDIYRSAQVLIREHGKGAAQEASRRADAMLEKGDMKGAAVWRRVLRAVEELRRKERREGEAAH